MTPHCNFAPEVRDGGSGGGLCSTPAAASATGRSRGSPCIQYCSEKSFGVLPETSETCLCWRKLKKERRLRERDRQCLEGQFEGTDQEKLLLHGMTLPYLSQD